MNEKLTSQEWCDRTGINIIDPDGWDRKVFEVDWLIPITRDEFLGKAFLSTCDKWPHPLLDEEQVKWEWPHPTPDDIVRAPKVLHLVEEPEPDSVVPLLTAINGLLEAPEVKGLLEAAQFMHSMYTALVDSGFTEAQALTLTSNMATGAMKG